MAKKINLRALQKQVQESTRGNPSADQQLHTLIYPDDVRNSYYNPAPKYTISIDMALEFAKAFIGPCFRWHRIGGLTRVYNSGFAASSLMTNDARALIDATLGAVLAMHSGARALVEVKTRRAA